MASRLTEPLPEARTALRQIEPIQSLRALAALMVVVGHAQTEALVAALNQGSAFAPSHLLPWGAGVDLFFAISGFIMVVASGRLFAAPGAAATFFGRRLKRIVPLYWLATTLYVAIQFATHKQVGGADLAASYLFWPRDVHGDGVLRPIYALGWTLQYEMLFYALFATFVALPRRACVAAVTAVLAAGVAANRVWALPPGPLDFWTQPIVLEFAFGMAVGLAWHQRVRLPGWARGALAVAAVAALAFDGLDAAHQAVTWITPTDEARVIAWGLPTALLVAAAALGEPRGAARLTAGLVALGNASYALYLVHPFVVLTLVRLYTAAQLGGRIGYWPFVGASLVLAIVVASAVHRWIEVPIARAFALRRLEGKPVLTLAEGG